MNTTTVSETQAVADDKAAQQTRAVLEQAQAAAQAGEAMSAATLTVAPAPAIAPDASNPPAAELRFIALTRLRLSKRDVRKTRAPVDALAESIARVGLLQNLIVVPVADEDDQYEVVAGGRRFAALRLLAKTNRIARDQTIPCLVVPDASAVTVSLTENVQRQDMHPADQFEAFLTLVNEGRPIEDIAADFGVTPLVVQRRLKLARISPRLMADYRQGGVTLEQLMALTLTDDHKAQEAAYFDAPPYEREPYALRRRLTQGDVEAARSPMARFVGVDAYTAAGGGLRRDLFAQEDGEGVTLTDADLLARLAADKLKTLAVEIRAEGWKWVEAVAVFGYSELAAFRRAPQIERQPTAKQAKRLAALQARREAIEEALHAAEENEDEDAAAKLYEQGDRVGEALDALYANLLAYAPETMAASGAVVTLDHTGQVIVHRGLLRLEDAKALTEAARAEHAGNNVGDEDSRDGEAEAPPAKTLSERLVRNLSAHRTAALQAELAKKPDVALAALVHRLALTVFYHGGDSVLQIAAQPQDGLTQYAPELAEGKAAGEFNALRTAWRDRLPADDADLFDALRDIKRADLLALLAVCVAGTVDGVSRSEHDTRAAALAQAVKLDMSTYWQPTAEAYFNHVPKAQTLAWFQAFKPAEVNRVAGYKKPNLTAEAAEHAIAAKWLPDMLRTA
ncbi:ParB/RepB/Spo0J family partition protein [Achromobacter mucicolens]|uniref:ParB/RepB/Spo0J family partition protein n=1 Tax=Achromobacter mucicolens TaxID=1389922 RepID=A0ABD4YZW9_9BURK|nr:ParB/RepB/Spo0J family partition protein [Achromobacter mucicolens]MDH1180091.1 ParB/RepB/Spo0J family partition protein [Achromobacter mucicolens]